MTSPTSKDTAHRPPSGHDPHHPATPTDTRQAKQDRDEKRHHPAQENALDSSQDKNPVPPGTSKHNR